MDNLSLLILQLCKQRAKKYKSNASRAKKQTFTRDFPSIRIFQRLKYAAKRNVNFSKQQIVSRSNLFYNIMICGWLAITTDLFEDGCFAVGKRIAVRNFGRQKKL
jgi:hypothetical protein